MEGGIQITGGTVNGSEVFFYNVSADGKQVVDIGGNTVVKLAAPTDGPYKGVLFFNNRSSPDRSLGNRIARGNSEPYFGGMLCFPSQYPDWSGNPETRAKWSMVVANTINVCGGAGVSVIAPPSKSQAPPVYTVFCLRSGPPEERTPKTTQGVRGSQHRTEQANIKPPSSFARSASLDTTAGPLL